MNEERVIGSSQNVFSKDKSLLTNQTTFCDEVTGSVDVKRAVDTVHLDF